MNLFLLKKNIKRQFARLAALFNKQARKDSIRVLMYHSVGGRPEDHPMAVRVPSANFEAEMVELKASGYKTLTISEIFEAAFYSMGSKYVAVTFDDGYKDNVTTAAEILRRLELKATFFITTSYIEGDSKKNWRDGEPRSYMGWEDVVKLDNMGFEIGSHMVHHIDLTTLSDERLFLELKHSKDIISKYIKKSVKVFSLPYGGLNKGIIGKAKEAGYIGGCSSVPGQNYSGAYPYILKRTEIDGYDTIEDFKYKLKGYYDGFENIRMFLISGSK